MSEASERAPLEREAGVSPVADAVAWRARSRRQQGAIVHLATSRPFASGRLVDGLTLITEVAAAALDVDRCSVWFLDPSGEGLECRDLFEACKARHSSGVRLEAASYPNYFHALRSGRAIDANDAPRDPRTLEFAQGYLDSLNISSMLDAAIRVGGKTIGVVCFEHVGAQRQWEPDELTFAGEVGDQVAHLVLADQRRLVEEERRKLWVQLTESERLRSVGTLAAGIAHDFNNILMPILAHAELAQLAVPADHPIREHLGPIVESAEKARRIIRQLLAMGRPHKSDATADLTQVAREVADLARASLSASIHLQLEIEDEPIPVAVDAAQLHQILLNLLLNGAYAMRGVAGPLTLRLQSETDEGGLEWARAEVIDSGHGMDQATMARVFEPFFTTKPVGEGLGLGLSVVNGIVRSAGGRIDVRSETGSGTTFEVHLPIVRATPEQGAAAQAIEPTRSLRILLVDDEKPVTTVLAAQLKHLGHDVTACYSAEEALERLRSDAFAMDLLITDNTMAGISGGELLRRAQRLRPGLRSILMSGLELDAGSHLDCVDQILLKPIRMAELVAAIRLALAD